MMEDVDRPRKPATISNKYVDGGKLLRLSSRPGGLFGNADAVDTPLQLVLGQRTKKARADTGHDRGAVRR